MKTVKITSPCYKSNGLNGQYISIAFCDNEGVITKVVGDHSLLTGKTITQIDGMSFSDDDRFITVTDCNVDMAALESMQNAYSAYLECRERIEEMRTERFGQDTYAYLYKCKKAERDARMQEYDQFCEETKIAPVDYYGFLIAIK